MSTIISPWGIGGGDHEYITGEAKVTAQNQQYTLHTATQPCLFLAWTNAAQQTYFNINAAAQDADPYYLFYLSISGPTFVTDGRYATISPKIASPGNISYVMLKLDQGDSVNIWAGGGYLWYQVYTA